MSRADHFRTPSEYPEKYPVGGGVLPSRTLSTPTRWVLKICPTSPRHIALGVAAVDKIRWSLRGLQVVLAAGVVGIADASVTIAVIDPVLAPDLALANVNTFICGEEALILCIHETGYEALRAIAAANRLGNQPQSIVNRLPDMFARIVHGREIATWNKGDLVPIAIVIRSQQTPRFLVLLTAVVERQPANRPGHPAVRAASCKGFAPRADVAWAIVPGLIETNRAIGSHLNLIHAYDGDVRQKSSAQWRKTPNKGRGTYSRSGQCERCRRTCCPAKKAPPGPVSSHIPFLFARFPCMTMTLMVVLF
jgi:hypothetical protein